ncbi:MAG: hypothetical protein DMF68_16440 [Acidobacteria bacterium]|nr:MAG: hypothetical protein DMF68_16440 [Acidobacteriota bacterium]
MQLFSKPLRITLGITGAQQPLMLRGTLSARPLHAVVRLRRRRKMFLLLSYIGLANNCIH